MIAFASSEVTLLQKRVALIVALGIVAAAFGLLPESGRSARWLFFDSATTIAQFATAMLLFGRFWHNRYVTTLIVACGFLFLALVSVREQLAMSGLIVRSDDAVYVARLMWLSAVDQLAFPLFILAAAFCYVYANRQVGKPYVLIVNLGSIAATVILAGVAISLATNNESALARLFEAQGGVYRSPSLVPPLAITLSVASALIYVAATRGKTLKQLWVSVALLANAAYVAFIVISRGEFVVAWYAGHYFALLAAVVIPCVHLYEFNMLHGRLEALNEVLEQQALFDELTGVGNRRMFDNKLLSEWNRGTRSGATLSLIIIDVDHFKLYNDAYGHQRGDRCLRAVAQTVRKCVARPTDVVTRYGGEEFAVILPNTEEAAACELADKMRMAVERARIPHKKSPVSTSVTLSLGVASCVPERGGHLGGLVKAADAALYRAKSAGRNQIASAGGTSPAIAAAVPQRRRQRALYDWQSPS